jgi:glycosyltransferase involved in cell wall biosynthesis
MRAMTIAAVVPCYNQAHYLREAIESVLGQTRPPDSVIVVDDGSTDDTPLVVTQFGARVRGIRQANAGLAAARNAGIRAAKADWIALLDSDDRWLPGRLEAQTAVVGERSDVGLVHGSYERIGADGELVDTRVHAAGLVLGAHDILERNPIAVCTTLFRREVVDEVGGFDAAARGCEDRDMWIRIAARYPVVAVPELIGQYRIYASSMSSNYRRMHAGRMYLLRKNRDAHGSGCRGCREAAERGMRNARSSLRQAADWECAAAFTAYEQGDYSQAWGHYRRAIRAWPGLLGDAALLRVLASLVKRSVTGYNRQR